MDHYATLADSSQPDNDGMFFVRWVAYLSDFWGTHGCFCQIHQLPMYFRPKSRASMDQAPGPIIANVPPKTISMSDLQVSLSPAKTIQNSMGTTSVPTTGVQSPARMNSPRTAPVISGIIKPALGASSCTMPLWRRAIPVKSRWMRRPAPGQPFANVENSRCKRSLAARVRHTQRRGKP